MTGQWRRTKMEKKVPDAPPCPLMAPPLLDLRKGGGSSSAQLTEPECRTPPAIYELNSMENLRSVSRHDRTQQLPLSLLLPRVFKRFEMHAVKPLHGEITERRALHRQDDVSGCACAKVVTGDATSHRRWADSRVSDSYPALFPWLDLVPPLAASPCDSNDPVGPPNETRCLCGATQRNG